MGDDVPLYDDYGSDFGSSSDYQQTDSGGGDNIMGGGVPAGLFQSLVGTGGPATVTNTAGGFGALAAGAGAAVLTLGGRLAGMFGRGAGTAMINGVKFSMSRLWPYINKYGPYAVSAALGITIEQLGALAMNAPRHARKRRRGISGADISRAKRVIRFNRRLSAQLGTGRSGGGYRRSYRPRPRRSYGYC